MVDVFDWLNRAMLSSVPPSKDFITTIFRWLHEFSGRTREVWFANLTGEPRRFKLVGVWATPASTSLLDEV